MPVAPDADLGAIEEWNKHLNSLHAAAKRFTYWLARATYARKSAADAAEFEQLRGRDYFEATMMIMTLVWGFGLLAQTALACALVFTLPIATYLLVSPFVGYGGMGALSIWTYLYAKRRTRIGKAMRAQAEQANGGKR